LTTNFLTGRPAALGVCALALLLMAGCKGGSNDTPATGTTGGGNASGGQVALAFVTNNPSDYWTICRKGTDAAAKELGNVSVQFIMPSDGTAATQKQDVDDLLAKGVKGIAISPVDPANETPYLNEVAAKTNLITSDSDAASSNRLCYIGTDNHAAGMMAGDLVKKALPAGGKIMVFVGKSDAQNAKDRIGGLRDALKGSNIQVLDVRTDDADHARAKQNAADVLTNTPDIAGLVGIWSYNGPAIASAVKEAGKIGKVKVVCFDTDPGTPEGIKDGTIFATVVQDPYTFGYKSIKLLAALAKGDKSGIPANKLMIVPNQAVNKDNIDAFLAEQKKKLGG
jgi:ribose transport system substrate-binding protein